MNGHTGVAMKYYACLLLTFLMQLLRVADGTATLSLTFVSYRNLGGYDINGHHCDFIIYRECDNVFDICLDRLNGSDDMASCAFFNQRTGEFSNNDDIVFDYDMMGVANPIIIRLVKWEGAKLKVKVTDDDTSNIFNPRHDLVDLLHTVHTNVPGVNGSYNSPVREVITSHVTRERPTSLTVSFQVKCDVTFYGPDCTRSCVTRNDDVRGHYTCNVAGDKVCLPGWTLPSTNCTLLTDDCHGNPCMNDGSCVIKDGAYNCACPTGFIGAQCEIRTITCRQIPCKNGGICHTDGRCRCQAGFHGDRCQCRLGRQGSNCDVIRSCSDNFRCKHGGTCGKGSVCLCRPGFTGAFCESTDNVSTGRSVQCQNGGTLSLINGSCLCLNGTYGSRCQHRVCDTDSKARCANGGRCVNGRCQCLGGFRGALCNGRMRTLNIRTGYPSNDNNNNSATVTLPAVTVAVSCDSSSCRHGGVCSASDGRSCECRTGFAGDSCEVVLCDYIACFNGGSCVGGACVCPGGFAGLYCQDAVNTKCSLFLYGPTCAVYCKPRGDTRGHYKCDARGNKVCLHGWEDVGVNCTTMVDDCVSHQCQNGARCQDGKQSYSCDCLPGFTGAYCEIDIDECTSDPCHNGATCRNLRNRFECACPPDYPHHLSATCSNYVCHHGNQCQNGGTCLGAGLCSCAPPYTGTRCDVILCDVIPCLNGGTCANGLCQCPPGMTGSHCHKVSGECASQPCMHAATCIQDGDAYTCACAGGFVGGHCQHRKYNPVAADLAPSISGTSGRPDAIRAPAICDLSFPRKQFVWLLVGIALLLLLIVISLAICLCRERRCRKNRPDGINSPATTNINNPLYPPATAWGRHHHGRNRRSSDTSSNSGQHQGACGGGSRHQTALPLGAKTMGAVNEGFWAQSRPGLASMLAADGHRDPERWNPNNRGPCGPPPSYDVTAGSGERGFDDGINPDDFELGVKGHSESEEAAYADLDEVKLTRGQMDF